MKVKAIFGGESQKVDISSCETIEEYNATITQKFSSPLPPKFFTAYKDKDSTSRIIKTDEDLTLLQKSRPKCVEIIPTNQDEESSSDTDSSAPYVDSCLELGPDDYDKCKNPREAGRQLSPSESDDEELEILLKTKKPYIPDLSVSPIRSQESEEDSDDIEKEAPKVVEKVQVAQKAQIPSNQQPEKTKKKDKDLVMIVDETQEIITKKKKKINQGVLPEKPQTSEIVQVQSKEKEAKPKKSQKPQDNHRETVDPSLDEETKNRIRATVLGSLLNNLLNENFAKFEKKQEVLWKSSQDFQKKNFEVQSITLNNFNTELTNLQKTQREQSERMNTILTSLQGIQKANEEQRHFATIQQETLAKIIEMFIKPDQKPTNPEASQGPSDEKTKSQSKKPEEPKKQEESKKADDNGKKKPKVQKRKKSSSSSASSSSSSDSSDSDEVKPKPRPEPKNKKKIPSSDSSDSSSDSDSEPQAPKKRKNPKQPNDFQRKPNNANQFFKPKPERKDMSPNFFDKNRDKDHKPFTFNPKASQEDKPKKKPSQQQEVFYDVQKIEEGGTNPEIIFPSAAKLYKKVKIGNSGLTTWPETCKLIHKEGVRGIEGKTEVRVPNVKPTDIAPITLELEGPSEPGHYSSVWRLSFVNKKGKIEEFGEPIRVSFNVLEPEEVLGSEEEEEDGHSDSSALGMFTENQPTWDSDKEKNDMINSMIPIVGYAAKSIIEQLVTQHPKKTQDVYMDMYFQLQNQNPN